MGTSNLQDKSTYVRGMFARISGCYDRANTLMTAGQDQRWRYLMAAAVACPRGGVVLDVATGTGESALALAKLGARVVGIDFCLEMLEVGRTKPDIQHHGLQLVAGDGLSLPFPDATFHGATTAFSLRNVASVPALLSEMRRVVRPGGKVVCLEFTPPRGRLLPPLYRLYSHRVVPLLARLAGGETEAYHYLPNSIDRFLRPEELRRVMEEAGLRQVSYRLLNFGTVALHVGAK